MDFMTQQHHGGDHLPPITDGPMAVTKFGKNVLWFVTISMGIASIIFYGLAARHAKKNRAFHYLTGFITTIAFISYMYMASGGSSVLIPARGRLAYREVLVARYIDWLFTTPLLLIDLGMFAGISPMDIVVLVFADVFMIVTGLLGAFRPDLPTRFAFFAISCLFLIWIIAGLVGTGLSVAKARHQKVYQTFLILSAYTIILWSVYPIVWAFAEGLNVISSDTEVLLFAILDLLAKPGFGGILLWAHAKITDVDFSLPNSFVEPLGSHSYNPISSSD